MNELAAMSGIDGRMRPYQLTIEERPNYLHAIGTGERTAGNAFRFLKEVYAACVQCGRSSALLEMRFSGPSLGTYDVYSVISDRSPDGAKLRRIAYLEPDGPDRLQARFAETVAVNRAVNVRLFTDLAEAVRWLEGEPST